MSSDISHLIRYGWGEVIVCTTALPHPGLIKRSTTGDKARFHCSTALKSVQMSVDRCPACKITCNPPHEIAPTEWPLTSAKPQLTKTRPLKTSFNSFHRRYPACLFPEGRQIHRSH